MLQPLGFKIFARNFYIINSEKYALYYGFILICETKVKDKFCNVTHAIPFFDLNIFMIEI